MRPLPPLLASAVLLLGSLVSAGANPAKPNVLFVIADAIRIERLFDEVQDATMIVGGAEIADDTGSVDFGTVLLIRCLEVQHLLLQSCNCIAIKCCC